MTTSISIQNKELLRQFYQKVYVHWDMTWVEKMVAPQFISHDWPAGKSGPEFFKAYYAAIRSAVPDATYEVDRIIAEDDKVVVQWQMKGTFENAFQGLAAQPTGQTITLKGIAIYRIEAGKLVERWVISDVHGLIEEVKKQKHLKE